jgi:uncharacterized LabA/DUF88 family protein
MCRTQQLHSKGATVFKPVTQEIEDFGKKNPERIFQLESFFDCPTNIYIDYANVRKRLGWKIDFQKLKHLYDSFQQIQQIKFYFGTISGPGGSEGFIRWLKKTGYVVATKPVKNMYLPIDVSSVSPRSTDLLAHFISETLIRNLKVDAIEYLNDQLRALNKQGITYLEHRKCNFDVEIGSDMRIDHLMLKCQGFCLWSGDSDFADPVKQLLDDRKKVTLFGVAGRISSELNELRNSGLQIFDIKKLRALIEQP